MKAHLLFKDRDFNLQQALPLNKNDLVQDLELNTLFNAMSQDDKFLFDVSRRVILSSSSDLEVVRYRQDILKDCLKNPSIIREIYQIPIESNENKRKDWLSIYSHYADGILNDSVRMMEMFVILLKKLRKIADCHNEKFISEGFNNFFKMIQKELDDDYIALVEYHLKQLNFQSGVLISSKLGTGNKGTDYILRAQNRKTGNWFKRIFSKKTQEYYFEIDSRDDGGIHALSDLRDKGVNLVANALAQSAEHIDSFLNMLRLELAFYIGCLNLNDQINLSSNPITFPVLEKTKQFKHSFRGLYDVSLALTLKQKIVGNNVNADHKKLVIITGANQGGKSTFLRSIGLAQLMMQAGMFVPSKKFSANFCEGIFTHFKRKEDPSMKSGKLDEELGRMSSIVELLSTNSLVLFNESFTATNEREGSEIARQITKALYEKKVKVFFVTHMFEFAHGLFDKRLKGAIFLIAERKKNGKRTFRIIEGEPLQTSFGEDVYKEVFVSP